MVSANSTILVNIIGDASKLTGTIKDIDTKLGTFGRVQATLARGASTVVRDAFGEVQKALELGDTFNDSITNISNTISPDFGQRVKDMAFNFSKIGLSAVEVAALSDNFANLATSARISQPAIEKALPDILTLAETIHAQTGKTVDEIVTDIGKAAAGSKKPIADLGVTIDQTLSPDDQLSSILDQLKAKYPDVTSAVSDLSGQQDQLNARWDNVLTKIGPPLNDFLSGVVGFINDEIDAIPGAIEGWSNLGQAVIGFGRTALGPLGNVNDALGGIGDLLGNIDFNLKHIGQNITKELAAVQATQNWRERNGQGAP